MNKDQNFFCVFIKSLIERKYRITTKLSASGNPTSNAILERVHQVLGNIVRSFNIIETYVDKYYPLLGILADAESVICATKNGLKGYIPGQLVFPPDMIFPINHKVGW